MSHFFQPHLPMVQIISNFNPLTAVHYQAENSGEEHEYLNYDVH